jgi:hypothetical protein
MEPMFSLPIQVSTFDELCAFIDASPLCPSVVDNMSFHLDEVLEFVCNGLTDDLLPSPYSPLSEPRTPVNPTVQTQPVSMPYRKLIDTAEHNNLEVTFDPNDWFVTHPATQKRRAPLLHEFLRLLLNNGRYKSYISWINTDKGVFKMHEPMKVANLWRLVKRRRSQKSVDYNTLARGIRSYYNNGLMLPTRTKYTFRFTEEALASFCD